MAGGNGRQRKAVTPKPQPKPDQAKQPDSAGGNGRKREKK